MKKILVIFAALVLLACGAQAQGKGSKNYVIGFYNLENLFDTYNILQRTTRSSFLTERTSGLR